MNITPVYELRTQLRTAAIAGTSLLSENFRLKKAAENFSAISSASPVFAKISEQLDALLKGPTPQAFLDVITLVDSVITALASVGTAAEITPAQHTENHTVIENIPYSRLSALIKALTTSGSGNFRTVKDAWETDKEIFRDYRVMPALISALGASYGELADLASDIIIEVGGKNVIPALKKDFDPKGKKDMVRRVEIIEKISGAKENDFYLTQLESAGNDIKSALILALSHDENNTEKLTELVRTEKAKVRKNALYVLVKFNNERAAQCVTEFSRKNPDEVLDVIAFASSEWTSDLAADIIKRILTDENGNAVKISQLSNGTDNGRQTAMNITGALYFKKGKAIEDIYRSYGDAKCAGFLSASLSHSISSTMDSGLIALADELNNSAEFKGRYDSSVAVAHILGDADCSDWIKKNIETAKNVMHCVYIENGRFIYNWNLNADRFTSNIPPREVKQPIKEKITDIFIKADHPGTAFTLVNWIDPDDPEYCLKLGKYFTKCFEKNSDRHYDHDYLSFMKKSGIKNVKGTVCRHYSTDHFKKFPQVWLGDTERIFEMLPGDPDYKLAEARSLVDSVKSGKIKIQFDIEDFTQWAETEMNKE